MTSACSWVSREHWAQCKGSAVDSPWAHTWKQLNVIDPPTQGVSCMSKEKFGQLFVWDASTSEIYRASKDREYYSGWAVPYSLCNHIQLNLTKIRVTEPGFGPYFPLWKKAVAKIPNYQVFTAVTETKSTQRSHNDSCTVTSPNHSPKKCKTNYIRVKLTYTHTKTRNSISETEIIGRLNFLKNTHFRIVYLCKDRTFYLKPFSPLETKADRTMGRIPFANYNILSDLLPAGSVPSEIGQAFYVCQLGKTYTLFSCLPSFLYLLLALQQKVKEENFTEGDHETSFPNIPHIFSA